MQFLLKDTKIIIFDTLFCQHTKNIYNRHCTVCCSYTLPSKPCWTSEIFMWYVDSSWDRFSTFRNTEDTADKVQTLWDAIPVIPQ